MNVTTFTKGDLVEIPQGIYIYKDPVVKMHKKTLCTKKPIVCLFLDYSIDNEEYAKVLFGEGEWFCPLKSMRWCELNNVN